MSGGQISNPGPQNKQMMCLSYQFLADCLYNGLNYVFFSPHLLPRERKKTNILLTFTKHFLNSGSSQKCSVGMK